MGPLAWVGQPGRQLPSTCKWVRQMALSGLAHGCWLDSSSAQGLCSPVWKSITILWRRTVKEQQLHLYLKRPTRRRNNTTAVRLSPRRKSSRRESKLQSLRLNRLLITTLHIVTSSRLPAVITLLQKSRVNNFVSQGKTPRQILDWAEQSAPTDEAKQVVAQARAAVASMQQSFVSAAQKTDLKASKMSKVL